MATGTLVRPATPPPAGDYLHGSPPDLKTAETWWQQVTTAIEATEAALAAYNASGVALDDTGLEVSPLEGEAWRAGQIARKHRLLARQRQLSTWMTEHGHGRPMRILAGKALSRDSQVRVDAMHAAVRRYILYDELMTRLQALLNDEQAAGDIEACLDDISLPLWNSVVEQVETIQNHGAS